MIEAHLRRIAVCGRLTHDRFGSGNVLVAGGNAGKVDLAAHLVEAGGVLVILVLGGIEARL